MPAPRKNALRYAKDRSPDTAQACKKAVVMQGRDVQAYSRASFAAAKARCGAIQTP